MNIKAGMLRLPVVGYFAKMVVSIYKLPKKIDSIFYEIQNLKSSTIKNKLSIKETKEEIKDIIKLSDDQNLQLINLNNKINTLNNERYRSVSKESFKQNNSTKYFADNHLLDNFYLEFENKFRGPEEQITERLEEYLPLFKSIKNQSSKKPVLDIGCGRGEFLRLMKSNNITSRGIDINEAMVKECKKKGFDTFEGDAIQYLSKSKPQSFSAITGFHIVEHIEFSDLLNLFSETYRAITDNGFVLFETPNPENLYVGAHTFYFDPSHIKPIPPQLLKFAMETVGFSEVEIMYLHPEKVQSAEDENIDHEIYTRLFGPRDYAVIAKK